MIHPFAKFISFLLNPIVIIVFLPFFLVYKTTHDVQSALHWAEYSFLFLVLLTATVYLGVRKGIFVNMDVSKREQRPLLFAICAIFGLVYFISLVVFHAPFVLILVTLGIMFGLVLLSFINRRIKASIHVATLTALVITIAVGYGGYFYLLLFLIPLVAWSRVHTNRHTVIEVITGGVLGVFLSTTVYAAYLTMKVLLHK